MSKKVLITGISGMDGSTMVDYLLRNTDHQIYGMIRRTAKPDYSNFQHNIGNPRFSMVIGDLSDSHSIDNLVKEIKPDYFINLAAQSFVGSSWQIPEQTFDVDAIGVIRCLEAIRKHVPNCRFYNAGSSEEFGDVQYSPQDMNHPLRARSPYGAAKIASRQITKVYRESYGLYAIQGLLYNHEGPRRGEEFVTRKITKGVARIKKAIDAGVNFEPIVLGNLESKRDWSHSEDFVEGIWMMINQESHNKELSDSGEKWGHYSDKGKFIKGSMGLACLSAEELDEYDNSVHTEYRKFLSQNIKEYILSSGETHSIREFIEMAFKAANIEIEDTNLDRIPPTEGNPHKGRQINYQTKNGWPVIVVSREFYRPAEVDLLLGDSTTTREELGWKPKHSFNDLVKEMVENDIANA